VDIENCDEAMNFEEEEVHKEREEDVWKERNLCVSYDCKDADEFAGCVAGAVAPKE